MVGGAEVAQADFGNIRRKAFTTFTAGCEWAVHSTQISFWLGALCHPLQIFITDQNGSKSIDTDISQMVEKSLQINAVVQISVIQTLFDLTTNWLDFNCLPSWIGIQVWCWGLLTGCGQQLAETSGSS